MSNQKSINYDFAMLATVVPELDDHLITNQNSNHLTIDWSSKIAVRLLNKALLLSDFGLKFYEIPEGYLFPNVPGRLAYIDKIHELLPQNNKHTIIDIGTGANLIYPILGVSKYKWSFVASDTDELAVKSSKAMLVLNPHLKTKIKILKQNPPNILKGIIQPGLYYSATMCNPPFYKSEKDYHKANQRKNNNLTLKSKSAGNSHELWTLGGELNFVANMIEESYTYQTQVGLFTTLISNKKHLPVLQKIINNKGMIDKVHEMKIGNKVSHLLTWHSN